MSERTQKPATVLAREAIDALLLAETRKAIHDDIAAFADKYAGTEFDLDPAFEAAGIEHWVESEKKLIQRRRNATDKRKT